MEDFVIEANNINGIYKTENDEIGTISVEKVRGFFQSDFLEPYLHAVRIEKLIEFNTTGQAW